MKKILAISDYGPAVDFAGGLVLAAELREIEKYYEVDWLILSSSRNKYEYLANASSKKFVFGKPGERFPFKRGSVLNTAFGDLIEIMVIKPWLISTKRKIKKSLSVDSYDHIFLTLQGQLVPRIADGILEKHHKARVQYWDPFTWWAREHSVPNRLAHRAQKAYENLNSKADFIIVPSEGMREVILNQLSSRTEFATLPKIKVLNIPTREFPVQKVPAKLDSIIFPYACKIIFAGSMYAKEEIGLLIQALDEVNWNIDGKSVGVLIIGPGKLPLSLQRPHVHSLGRLEVSLTDSLLSKADILFLPYPIKEIDIAKESFPSKLSTYVSARKPILFLIPDDSSLSKILKSVGIKVGISHNYSATNLIMEIKKLVAPNTCKEHLTSLTELEQKYLTQDIFESNIKTLFPRENPGVSIKLISKTVDPPREIWMKLNRLIHFLSRFGIYLNLPFEFLRRVKGKVRQIVLKILTTNKGKQN